MIDVLFASGCSYTHGSELVSFNDEMTQENLEQYGYKTFERAWPKKLATKLNIDKLYNYGCPGASNEKIIRTTTSWVEAYKAQYPDDNMSVVCCFTELTRHEFACKFEEDYYRINFIGYSEKRKVVVRQYDDIDLNKPFLDALCIGPNAYIVRNLLNKELDAVFKSYIAMVDTKILKDRFVNELKRFVAYLEQNGIQYLFCFAFECPLSKQDLVNYNFAQDNFYIEDSFHECFNRNNVKTHEGGHPQELGHEIWANELTHIIKTRKINV